MDRSLSDTPAHPKLRPLDSQWVEHEGQRYLFLRDPLALAEASVLVPRPLVPLLALCDGTRDVQTLQAGLALRTGVQLSIGGIQDFLVELDTALLLENGSYGVALAEALKTYREADSRPPSHAGLVYPEDPDALTLALVEYFNEAREEVEAATTTAKLVGMVCPHIDYTRGHETYARLWQRAAPMLEDVELAIIFGTDHSGATGALTPTRQSYRTPLGVMPTEMSIVDGLADILGPERAFAEEIHHVNEHSIDLALVWFHYILGRVCPIVPILCGSFHHFVMGEEEPEQDQAIDATVEFLREASAARRTLVIAAADLAHVGPAFGDPLPIDMVGRAKLVADDSESIAAICRGDAVEFFERSRRESDARRLCGLPPIYMALRTLNSGRGESLGYAQCPADDDGGSLVSIAGVLLYED